MSRLSAGAAALAAAALLAGCAGVASVQPGDTDASVQQRYGAPSDIHELPGGARRLEYATGPFGKTTTMVDIDAQGRVTHAANVMDEVHFARIMPGITIADLRRELGRPARVWAVRYHDQTVWSYRYETPFCTLFHVGITPQGVVEDTSYGPDPLCERDARDGLFGRR